MWYNYATEYKESMSVLQKKKKNSYTQQLSPVADAKSTLYGYTYTVLKWQNFRNWGQIICL